MADQVNPTGSLAPGIPSTLLAASAPRTVSDSSRTAKPTEIKAQGPVSSPNSGTPEAPEAAVEQLNGHLQQSGSELKFQVDKATGRTIYKVVNPGNGQVLLQVPSEEVLAMARNVRAMGKQTGASGVLVDKEG